MQPTSDNKIILSCCQELEEARRQRIKQPIGPLPEYSSAQLYQSADQVRTMIREVVRVEVHN